MVSACKPSLFFEPSFGPQPCCFSASSIFVLLLLLCAFRRQRRISIVVGDVACIHVAEMVSGSSAYMYTILLVTTAIGRTMRCWSRRLSLFSQWKFRQTFVCRNIVRGQGGGAFL